MKKFVMLLVLMVSAAGSNALAFDCPLKNLNKNQTRFADGTAFVPGKTPSLGQHKTQPAQPGAVYIGN